MGYPLVVGVRHLRVRARAGGDAQVPGRGEGGPLRPHVLHRALHANYGRTGESAQVKVHPPGQLAQHEKNVNVSLAQIVVLKTFGFSDRLWALNFPNILPFNFPIY